MTPEIRNLKGEIIRDPDRKKWYQLSSSTWLLIAGLVLFNIGCCVNPGIIDQLFRLLDIRLWPWWYFPCLILLAAFSIKWFFIYRNWEDYDEMDAEAARRFTRLAIAIIIVMAILVLLNLTNMYGFFYRPLTRWLGYGEFTWIALFSFMLIICAIGPVVYFAKEWIVTFLNQ